jgi:hypothetical protein
MGSADKSTEVPSPQPDRRLFVAARPTRPFIARVRTAKGNGWSGATTIFVRAQLCPHGRGGDQRRAAGSAQRNGAALGGTGGTTGPARFLAANRREHPVARSDTPPEALREDRAFEGGIRASAFKWVPQTPQLGHGAYFPRHGQPPTKASSMTLSKVYKWRLETSVADSSQGQASCPQLFPGVPRRWTDPSGHQFGWLETERGDL